jgi:DNA-binding SARP family transcriptional activator
MNREPPVRFVLLGAVQVWRRGQEGDLGGQLARDVLARLLLAAGRSVPTAELVDTLWPEDPPPTSVNMVHRVVGHLRRLLEPGLGPRESGQYLIRDSSGVRLHVTAATSDLVHFRALISQAAGQQATDGPAAALPTMVAALALWTGSASTAVGERLSQHPLVVALDRERVAAARDTADAALAANDPRQAIDQVQAVADDNPLDEGLQARLMLLLAAVGEQAEALRIFDRAQESLASAIGLEPGDELIAARRSVRRGSAALAHSATEMPTPGRPAQLPPPLRTFAGRGDERASLVAACQDDSGAARIQVVYGMAGAGKTTLAVQVAHHVADRYPDGQLYVNLRGYDSSGRAVTVSEAQTFLLGSLGLNPAAMPESAEARTAELRSRLWGRRMLLLLDNARDVEQVRPLLPGAPGCMVIVTSRHSLTGLAAVEGAALTRLGRMTEAEAAEMLVRRVGTGWSTDQDGPVAEIVGLCSALPLALAIVASRAAAMPDLGAADIAGQLRLSRGSLDAFSLFDGGPDIRGVFSWSYRSLTTTAARLFRLLSIHPGPHIGLTAAASLLGEPPAAARSALEELATRQLVSQIRAGRYQMHDLLRIYAGELGHALPADEQEARLRLLNYYLHAAYDAERLVNPARRPIEVAELLPGVLAEPIRTEADVHSWRAAEEQVVGGLVRTAAARGLDSYTWQLTWSCTFAAGSGHEMLELAAVALEHLGDLPMLARVYNGLGLASARISELDQAEHYFDRALDVLGRLDDPDGLAYRHLGIAEFYVQHGRQPAAEEHVDRAAELFEKTGDHVGRSYVLSARAWLKAVEGHHHEAIALAEQALTMFASVEDNWGRAAVLDTLGYAYLHLGDLDRAEAILAEAGAAAEKSGNRTIHTVAWMHIGDVAQLAGKASEARQAWRRSQELGRFDDALVREIRARLGPEEDEAEAGPVTP